MTTRNSPLTPLKIPYPDVIFESTSWNYVKTYSTASVYK
jgi:hypothetical protein